MKCATEVGSDAMMFIPDFKRLRSGIWKFIEGIHREHGLHNSSSYFQNKENWLKIESSLMKSSCRLLWLGTLYVWACTLKQFSVAVTGFVPINVFTATVWCCTDQHFTSTKLQTALDLMKIIMELLHNMRDGHHISKSVRYSWCIMYMKQPGIGASIWWTKEGSVQT